MKKCLLFFMLMLFLLTSNAFASNYVSTNIEVQIDYLGACTVQANNINAQIASVAVNATAVSAVKVTCANGINYEVGIGSGNNVQGNIRRAKSGANDYMKYRIYKEEALQNEVLPLGTLANGQGTGEEIQHALYLAVKAEDNPTTSVRAGMYTDTLEIRINW